MEKYIFSGYMVKGPKTIDEIELIVFQMESIINNIASKQYLKLWIRQVERITDEIFLNQFTPNGQEKIADIAEKETKRRILYADQNQHQTEYNLYCGMQIMTAKYKDEPVILFFMHMPNDIYSHMLEKKIKELIPFELTEKDLEADPKNEKRKLAEHLQDIYDKTPPLSCTLINYNMLTLDVKKIVFRTPEERAKDIATEKVLNHLLACYSTNGNIQPHKLMEFTLQAINRLKCADMQRAIAMETEQLILILPEITEKLILGLTDEQEEKEQ